MLEGQFAQVSFVNSIATSKGGTHVNLVADQIVKSLHERISKRYPDLGTRPAHIRNHLFVFVSCLVENPAFDSQVTASALQPFYLYLTISPHCLHLNTNTDKRHINH
jgi:DNA topoisomerase II